IRELRQPRPGYEVGAGNDFADGFAHRACAEHQRLQLATRVQEAIREDVSAFWISGELNLVDGEEVDVDLARHRFDGRDPEARVLRLDLLFTGDERNLVDADALDDLVVNLTREQP